MRKLRKLTRLEYDELQYQFDNTPAPDQGYMLPTGEHWILKQVVDDLGFSTGGTDEAYELASELLSRGCTDDAQEYPYAYH